MSHPSTWMILWHTTNNNFKPQHKGELWLRPQKTTHALAQGLIVAHPQITTPCYATPTQSSNNIASPWNWKRSSMLYGGSHLPTHRAQRFHCTTPQPFAPTSSTTLFESSTTRASIRCVLGEDRASRWCGSCNGNASKEEIGTQRRRRCCWLETKLAFAGKSHIDVFISTCTELRHGRNRADSAPMHRLRQCSSEPTCRPGGWGRGSGAQTPRSRKPPAQALSSASPICHSAAAVPKVRSDHRGYRSGQGDGGTRAGEAESAGQLPGSRTRRDGHRRRA